MQEMAKGRATKVDKHLRVAQLVRLISNGAVTSELIGFARDNWGLGRAQAERYIAEAREAIIEDINHDRKVVVAELMHGAHTIWKAALKDKQYNNALGAMNLISRLGGLEVK